VRNRSSSARPRDIVSQIRHIADVAGSINVGFGADFYGLDWAAKRLGTRLKYPALTEALLKQVSARLR